MNNQGFKLYSACKDYTLRALLQSQQETVRNLKPFTINSGNTQR